MSFCIHIAHRQRKQNPSDHRMMHHAILTNNASCCSDKSIIAAQMHTWLISTIAQCANAYTATAESCISVFAAPHTPGNRNDKLVNKKIPTAQSSCVRTQHSQSFDVCIQEQVQFNNTLVVSGSSLRSNDCLCFPLFTTQSPRPPLYIYVRLHSCVGI